VFAAIGVVNELYRTGGFSWTTLIVALDYPIYVRPSGAVGRDGC
jgi:chloramphenicol-sensitive protein RarD